MVSIHIRSKNDIYLYFFQRAALALNLVGNLYTTKQYMGWKALRDKIPTFFIIKPRKEKQNGNKN